MPTNLVAPLLVSALAFGPADPAPPRTATCFDAAADTIAIGRETTRGWVIETSTADGPWQRVIGPVVAKGPVCPVLGAAPDGTAVVAAGSDPARVAIRAPGSGFGNATALPGGRTGTLLAAAASGGHVAVLWGPRDRGKIALSALTAAPGRPSSRTVITRSGTVEHPALVLAPDGTATATWNALHPLRKRMSEFRSGRWGSAVNVATSNEFSAQSGVSVALAPNGRRLLAWEADDGVRVQVDGEPPVAVAKPDYVSAITGALADDGSAVVTFIDDDGPLTAVDRAPGGAWSQPHALPLGDEIPDTSFRGDLLGQQIALAPGGQAVITWPLEKGRIAAVQGQAGGAWAGAGSLLSSPVRFASEPRFVGGRSVWLEPDGYGRPGRLRGARLGAPQPRDTTAPRFSARAAGRLAPQRPGPITVPIEVRCSEACDALATFDGVEEYAARLLVADKAATLRVPAWLSKGDVRINVAVADRAGNQARRTIAVRVRRR